ncbi:MAG: hypothetical protein JW735_13355 [Prolixibacteraceae bacterium]|nr:hypothetical protein [Prolixibacteraceae bacterium]
MKPFRILLVVFLFISVNNVFGSDMVFTQHGIKRTNNFTSYKDPVFLLGASLDVAYLRHIHSFSPMLQLNYQRYVTRFLSVGFGYSGIFIGPLRNSFTFDTSLNIYDNFYFSLRPGCMLRTTGNKTSALYLIAFSSKYLIPVTDKIDLSPKIDFMIAQDEFVYSVGIHFGYNF